MSSSEMLFYRALKCPHHKINSNNYRGRASEDRDEGYVIANLHAPLQTALSQNSTNKVTNLLILTFLQLLKKERIQFLSWQQLLLSFRTVKMIAEKKV